MLSQTVEYALRAAVYLATRGDTPATTDEAAERTQVGAAYLSKVFQALGKKGIVRTQRGAGGGVVLARPPAELSILDIVNAVEPIRRINICPLGLPAHDDQLCPLHQTLDDAYARIEAAFAAVTLAELVDGSSDIVPLCLPVTTRTSRDRP